MSTLRQKVISGGGWLTASSAGRQMLSFLVQMILARLLAPADYGLFALVLSVLSLSEVFSELGISVAIIQRKEVSATVLDSAFCMTAVVALALGALVWVCADWVAAFYRTPELSGLVRLAAVMIFVRKASTLQRALLVRSLRYRAVAVTEILALVVSGSINVLLAWRGWGPRGLVIGSLVGGLFSLVCMIVLTRFVPLGFGSWRCSYELLQFGVWVFLSRVLGRASSEFDKFVIARVLNSTSLGLYYFAQGLVTLFPNTWNSIMDTLLFPVFSRMQENITLIEHNYWRIVRLQGLVSLPVCAVLGVFAKPLLIAAFGQRWVGAVPLVQALAVFAATDCLGGGVVAPVIYALGKPQVATLMNLFRVLALPAFIMAGSRWGVDGIAWFVAAYGICGRLFNQMVLSRVTGIRFTALFRHIWRPLLASSVLVVAGVPLLCVIPERSLPLRLAGSLVAGVLASAAFAAVAWRLMPEEAGFLISELRSRLGSFLSGPLQPAAKA